MAMFYYEHLKVNRNIALIVDYREKMETASGLTISDARLIFDRFNVEILEDTVRLRSAIYFQFSLILIFVILSLTYWFVIKRSLRNANV